MLWYMKFWYFFDNKVPRFVPIKLVPWLVIQSYDVEQSNDYWDDKEPILCNRVTFPIIEENVNVNRYNEQCWFD